MCDYINMPSHLLGESRYEPNGISTAAQHGVATPWNGMTIPRRCALFYVTVDVPYRDVGSTEQAGAFFQCTLQLVQPRIIG